MMKLADMQDLGSCAERRWGSNPHTRTNWERETERSPFPSWYRRDLNHNRTVRWTVHSPVRALVNSMIFRVSRKRKMQANPHTRTKKRLPKGSFFWRPASGGQRSASLKLAGGEAHPLLHYPMRTCNYCVLMKSVIFRVSRKRKMQANPHTRTKTGETPDRSRSGASILSAIGRDQFMQFITWICLSAR